MSEKVFDSLHVKVGSMDDTFINNPKSVAGQFSASKAYAAGDYVYYNRKLYCFTAAHAAGAWTGSDASEATVSGELSALKADLTEMPDAKKSDAEGTDLDITDQNGNVIARFKNGHIEVKNFDSSDLPSIVQLEAAVGLVGNVVKTVNGESPDASGEVEIDTGTEATDTTSSSADLYLCDDNGNVIAYFADGHIITKNFDSSDIDVNAVKTVNHVLPDSSGNVDVAIIPDPSDIADAVDDYLDEHPVVASASGIVSVADYNAVGDGETDDSAAIQNAVDANYDVYFESNKTYYLASPVIIDHDIKLHGGENTVIKTKTPSGGVASRAFVIEGTKKKTTTLTSNYTSQSGNTDNCVNRFTFADISGINIGDIFVIAATDQYYNYSRQYYYLGGTLPITDIYDGHIYSCMNMPWDIENTANVSVEVYEAPVAIVENLHFVSDHDSIGHYIYCLTLSHCKNSIIRNCTFTTIDSGISIGQSVNCIVDGVTLAKSKWDNALTGDQYGISVNSSTNTIIERVLTTCAQHSITVTGSFPSINTLVRNCNLTSECRAPGLDTHESTYNLTIEDCVLGSVSLNGTATMNRCRVINNRRTSNSQLFVYVYGSHNPEWSKVRITNTIFDGTGVYVEHAGVQSPIQAFDNIIGSLEIENCYGGMLYYEPTVTSDILSNTIKNLMIRNWANCHYIRFNGVNRIESMSIEDSTFRHNFFINDGNLAHGVITTNIENLDIRSASPLTHKVTVSKSASRGESYSLPENVPIQLSSGNSSAKFLICGSKLTSDNSSDYVVGNVSGADGAALVRETSSAAVLTIDANGNPVYTQGSNTSPLSFYPVGLLYAKETSVMRIAASIKNTGATNGATFKPMIAIVDSDGKITYRGGGTEKTATAEGEEVAVSRTVTAGCVAMGYMYCSSPISSSETTFEDFSITCTPLFAPADPDEQYTAKRLTGDGTILSLEGVNNIMSSENTFGIQFAVDYIANPV